MNPLVKYPFPLRTNTGQICYFEVPYDLTLEEVEKISNYLKTMCTDFTGEKQSAAD